MYLKRLDLQGFKSFANKTALEFGSGVTCVIGPNGTGKTNVADAIRWVLGEHSSRTLRARKTEDVIFAGSDKRAAMGVAEVSITLDNSEGWLPVDFSEVVVGRRAYRNGESEYLINGSRVRLRDVIELFMRAQVGQNSYAFMGQGMVEQVLSLRPEDRRALIEEAADVRLYRSRLEEAQHKLKATRENLDRVYLVVREIEPRINQLERQAGRAVKYRELARELAATLHVWYAHQWSEVTAQLLGAQTAHEQQAEELTRASASVKSCEDGLAQLRSAIEERRREIAAGDAKLASVQDYARDLERRVGLDAERGRLLGERLAELTAEIAALRDDEAAQEAAATRPDQGDLEARVRGVRAQLMSERERLTAVEQELQRLQRSVLGHEQAATRAAAALEDPARLGALAPSPETDESPGAASVRAARERAERGLTALERDRTAVENELRSMQLRVESVHARMEVLERIDVRPQAPDAGVRMVLEAGGVIPRETISAEVELSGVVGLLGQVLRVPPGLEKAIEAALAENLFAIVVERQSDARAAVELLLQRDAGRATLYALDGFSEMRPLNLIRERGVVGVASHLVRCESRFRKLVDTVLGRTVVVEDASLAQRVVRRGLAGAVATLDGVLLRPVGSVSAGSLATVQASFVRERESDDLPAELAKLGAAIEEGEAKLRDTEARIAEAADRLREAIRAEWSAGAQAAVEQEREDRDALGRLEEERRELTAAVDEHATELAQLDGLLRSDWQVGEVERLARERLGRQISTKDEQRASVERDAREVSTRLAATERELAERSGEVDALRAELEPARQELAQLESRERSLTGELAEAGARMRSLERSVMESENEVRIRGEELETLRTSLEAEGFVATQTGEIERAPEPEVAEDEGLVGAGAPPSWLRTEEDGGLPPVRGGSAINPTEVRDRIADLRAQIRGLGPVNEAAASDYEESRERYDFLSSQLGDLREAEGQLNEAIGELEGVIRERFRNTFRTVNQEFERYFSAFFRGGTARLELGETDEDGLPGIEIIAQPPGKKLGSLALLSGGERSLTAVALLFALLQANPSPICVLDEVDAALDEANVGRFVEELRQLAQRTQFIIITHNRRTIEQADTIYGVSMGADNVSRVLSLRLGDVSKHIEN
ncbi:MAG: AAA family ATPase [Dehalococcoidia bacterium]